MATMISHMKVTAIKSAICTAFRNKNFHIELMLETDWEAIDKGEPERAIFAVNWSAIGSVDSEKARAFGNALTLMADIVDALNAQEWRMDRNYLRDFDNENEFEMYCTLLAKECANIDGIVDVIPDMI